MTGKGWNRAGGFQASCGCCRRVRPVGGGKRSEGGGRVTQRALGSEGTHPPENEETRLSESPRDEKAA